MHPMPNLTVSLNIQDWEFHGKTLMLYLAGVKSPTTYSSLKIEVSPIDVYEAAMGTDEIEEWELVANQSTFNGAPEQKRVLRDPEEKDITPEILAKFLALEMPFLMPA